MPCLFVPYTSRSSWPQASTSLSLTHINPIRPDSTHPLRFTSSILVSNPCQRVQERRHETTRSLDGHILGGPLRSHIKVSYSRNNSSHRLPPALFRVLPSSESGNHGTDGRPQHTARPCHFTQYRMPVFNGDGVAAVGDEVDCAGEDDDGMQTGSARFVSVLRRIRKEGRWQSEDLQTGNQGGLLLDRECGGGVDAALLFHRGRRGGGGQVVDCADLAFVAFDYGNMAGCKDLGGGGAADGCCADADGWG